MDDGRNLQTERVGRGVITMGFGAAPYRRMAAALAHSIRLTNPTLSLAVVTDHPDDPQLRERFDEIVRLEPAYGHGVEQKLSLDRYTPYEQTLYIDADCLVVRSLDEAFELMSITPFGVVGFPVVEGFYWAEVRMLMDRFDVPYIGRFNAGLICFDDARGRQVFETARRLAAERGLDGLPTYRGALLDEIPLAAALGELGIIPIYDDGRIMRAPEPLESRMLIDVRNGRGRFKTKGRWVEPAVVHFAYLFHGTGLRGAVYRREAKRVLGERVTVPERVACIAAQAVFAVESLPLVRSTWKRHRGAIRARVLRLAGRVTTRGSTAATGS